MLAVRLARPIPDQWWLELMTRSVFDKNANTVKLNVAVNSERKKISMGQSSMSTARGSAKCDASRVS